MALTTVQSGMMDSVAQYNGFKNRIINGAMVISQRNGSTLVANINGIYAVDRMYTLFINGVISGQQQDGGPTGFSKFVRYTVTSAGTRTATDYHLFQQIIEGSNLADFGFGSVGASSFTFSFWVRSSIAGLYSGVINSGNNNRGYGYTFTINAANTWEQKTITIAGDTSGGTTAWPTGNGQGMFCRIDLGSGSNYQISSAGAWLVETNKIGVAGTVSWAQTAGATFDITGIQLEKGVTATSFDYRPNELQLCQRYFEKSFPQATVPASSLSATGANHSSATKATTGANQLIPSINFKVTKRAAPSTVTTYSPTVAGAQAYNVAAGACSSTALYIASDTNLQFTFTGNAGGVIGDIIQLQWTAEAEL